MTTCITWQRLLLFSVKNVGMRFTRNVLGNVSCFSIATLQLISFVCSGRKTAQKNVKELTCVYCRAPWVVPAPASGSKTTGTTRGGYVNLANVAGLSPVRDTSTCMPFQPLKIIVPDLSQIIMDPGGEFMATRIEMSSDN